MVFSTKQDRGNYPDLYMSNTVINKVSSHTHLGLTYSDDLSWDKHIDRVTTNAMKSVNLMKRLYRNIPREQKCKIYKIFVRPKLEYGNIIFDACSDAKAKQLENVQRQAALTCSRAYRVTSTKSLLDDLGWDPLSVRRQSHKLTIFFKMIRGIAPAYLQQLLPRQVGEISGHNLRNSSQFRMPRTRTVRYMKSFIPSTIKTWNMLDIDIRNATTLGSFKKQLYKQEGHRP